MANVNPSMDHIMSPIFGIGNGCSLNKELISLKSGTTLMLPFLIEIAKVGELLSSSRTVSINQAISVRGFLLHCWRDSIWASMDWSDSFVYEM
jgi:hypothetical protein